MRLLLSVIMSLHAGAEPILFRAPGASELEYRARLRTEEAFRTPTQAYLAQHPHARARETLLARFTRAQTAFLTNSTGEARRHFQEVVALLPTDDWAATDREVFLNAYLRLAQLENGTRDRDHWLTQIPFLGPGLKIQTDLFPPPLLERLRALQRGPARLYVDFEKLDWPLLVINGVPCRPHNCPSFPASETSVRVTFVSDVWVTQTVQADLAELARLRPAKINWVTGACQSGGLTAAARDLGGGRPFFSLACDDGKVEPTFAPALALAEDPKSLPVAAVTAVAPKRRPFYKSPWLWATVGAVAITAVVVAVNSSQRHSSSATTPAPSPGPSPRERRAPAPTPDEPSEPIVTFNVMP